MNMIRIRGARTHNLKNINLELPRNQLTVITGLSGSGKSSLAFDTLYAEGQRRYVESLSAYARQFLSVMEKPDVEMIEGLSPAISIEQKTTSHNPRSTVGTITEIYDYLRLLYARIGQPRCPEHGIILEAQTISQIVDNLLEQFLDQRIMLLAPMMEERRGEHHLLLEKLQSLGFLRARINGVVHELDQPPTLDPRSKHTIEAVVDRLRVRQENRTRLAESIETALSLSDAFLRMVTMDGEPPVEKIYSAKFSCPICSYSVAELEPRTFSFNNPAGACTLCDGLGKKVFFDPKRIVPNPQLSLEEGAVQGWSPQNGFYYQLLTSLSEYDGFSLETPFEKLSAETQDRILYGTGDEMIPFNYAIRRGGRGLSREHRFRGVIANMERRLNETESPTVREELGRYQSTQVCSECQGGRLNLTARNVLFSNRTLPEVTALSVSDALHFFETVTLEGFRRDVAKGILTEIISRLTFLEHVGLDYLSLDRSADTLSGGETQRIRLASQIGAGLVGVLYVLDEPSIGLHQRDNQRLLGALKNLRDLGNSVIMVEHDEEAIREADHLIDIGPGAGLHGGEVVAEGSLEEVMNSPRSLTGDYLSGRLSIPIPEQRLRPDPEKMVKIVGARGNNLKNLNVSIPTGLMVCITGVSGSGKSTLINETLYRHAAKEIHRTHTIEAPIDHIEHLDLFDKVINIDQSPIGRTPRSNPATYTGVFTPIRELFSQIPEARARGYTPGRFSFNLKGGRCEACQGDGLIRVEMHFLADIFVPCDLCAGQRFNRETLEIKYKGKSIHDVLEMTVEDALNFFKNYNVIARRLETLMAVGLGYIKLGQNATTLSGGEAQRIKLSKELSRRATGNTLYILDEPTTGLHFHDIRQLLEVLTQLRDQGNTVIVIEHNLDVIKCADWIIDLGPEGGSGGGELVAEGSPEEVAHHPHSYTGHFLRDILKDRLVSEGE
jgi:excinuclease ABC subunit A